MRRYKNAIHLLSEIEAWLSLNQTPSKEDLVSMKQDIVDFLKSYHCPLCGNTGLIDYIQRESNGEHTEFRVVVNYTGKGRGYIHVIGRSSETFDFDLPDEGVPQKEIIIGVETKII